MSSAVALWLAGNSIEKSIDAGRGATEICPSQINLSCSHNNYPLCPDIARKVTTMSTSASWRLPDFHGFPCIFPVRRRFGGGPVFSALTSSGRPVPSPMAYGSAPCRTGMHSSAAAGQHLTVHKQVGSIGFVAADLGPALTERWTGLVKPRPAT
jgi:hypothetical protein